MEQLKALTKGRARLKANITRSLAWAEDEQNSNATRAEVSSRLKHLDTTWKEFNRFGDEIAMLDEVDGYVDSERQQILRGKISKGRCITFGDEWPAFKDIYESTIHNKANLTNTHKFHHLKSLLIDEAANLVRHLAIADSAYNTAWERLNERYNRPRHIVNSLLEQFMKLPTTTRSDTTTLRKVSDGANEIVRGLDAIEETGRDCWIIYLTLEKLDADTRRRWIERSVETDSPTLEEFFKFLDARCEELKQA
ncbi:uncharacterized protein LOC123258253 [Drosophila ananassae]|uniref:uncharacterized protein LOC123258253 n=1 Tax=Drosophila ananassae TaxID=7217 RepID=UPI001CFF5BBD|nr:uncharacterized protein LOC123258253 [Drosophila ananassae]